MICCLLSAQYITRKSTSQNVLIPYSHRTILRDADTRGEFHGFHWFDFLSYVQFYIWALSVPKGDGLTPLHRHPAAGKQGEDGGGDYRTGIKPHSSILHNHTEYSIAQIPKRIKGYGEISREKVDEIRRELSREAYPFYPCMPLPQ